MRMVPSSCAWLLISAASMCVSAAQEGTWDHWTTSNGVRGLVAQGEHLWAAVGEGLIRYDTGQGSYVRHTTADGLPNHRVVPLLVDASGNLWAAAYGVVCRYDGSQWTNWSKQEGIPDRVITCSLLDDSGHVWIGTNWGGVSRFDGTTWTTWNEEHGVAHPNIRCLAQDQSGNIWIGTEEGISRFDGHVWQSWQGEYGINSVLSLAADDLGNVWVGTGGDVAKFNGSTWSSDGLRDGGAACLLKDNVGHIWAVTQNGVSRYDGSGWTTWSTADVLRTGRISSLVLGRDGHIWAVQGASPYELAALPPVPQIASEVSRFDGSTWRSWTVEDGLGSHGVWSVLQDRAGTVWAGTGDGLSRLDGSAWHTWQWLPRTEGGAVFSLLEDAAGDIWAGSTWGVGRFDGSRWVSMMEYPGYFFAAPTPGAPLLQDASDNVWVGLGHYTNGSWGIGGLSRFDGHNWTIWTRKNMDSDVGFVHALLLDDAGNVWAGTDRGGVIVFDGEWQEAWTEADGLASNTVHCLLLDDSGNVWAGTDQGVSRSDGSVWTTWNTEDGLAANRIGRLLQDHSGDVWAGTEAGVCRFDGISWRKEEHVPPDDVTALLLDGKGNIWVGTAGGVGRYDGEAWMSWSTSDGLAAGRVTCLLVDAFDRIWVGTTAVWDWDTRQEWGGGVSRLDGAKCTTWTAADGLPSSSVSALLLDRTGNIWAGMDGGMSRFTPATVTSVQDDTEAQESQPPALLLNAPNSFNAATTITFVLSAPLGRSAKPSKWIGEAELAIYNSLGQRVRTLFDGTVEDGRHSLIWDGKDAFGRNAASGLYFYRLTVDDGNWTNTRKMLLAR